MDPLANSFNKVLTIKIWWNDIKVLSLYPKSNIMKYIEFSLDFEGNCESIDVQEGFPFEVTEDDINQFVSKLVENDIITLSEHRTEMKVEWSNVSTMDISVVSYNSPNWDDFDEHSKRNVLSIEIENSL